jgi:hypothetical protein
MRRNQVMDFRPVPLACECGLAPARFRGIGFTPEQELVVHWRCLMCGKLVYVVKPLVECLRECPPLEDSSIVPVPGAKFDFKPDDAKFLHTLGISVEDPGA